MQERARRRHGVPVPSSVTPTAASCRCSDRPDRRNEAAMGLFGNMYDKRKAKIAESAAPFLGAGEVAGTTAICQSENQAAMQALFGKHGMSQFLATATDENFYVFAISPIKNEVFGESVQTRPMAALDAHMDGRRAVVGEFRLAAVRVPGEMQELVDFVQQRSGAH